MDIKLLSCPLCLKPHFDGVDALRSSLITVATSALACPVCNELLMGLDKLTIHLFSHITNNISHENQSIDQTNIPASKSKATVEHLMEVDRATNVKEVNNVNENAPPHSGLEDEPHRNELNEKKNCLRCDICNFCFNDENILDMHQKLLHQTSLDKKTGSYSYHCHLCTKKFRMRGSLMVHLRVAHYGFGHHVEEHDCLSSDSEPRPSSSHTGSQSAQEPAEEVLNNQYSCVNGLVVVENGDVNMCSNSEEVKSGNSKDNKQWECDVCSKLFTTKYFLKKHKRLHTGEMPYFCSLCNKSFTFQQSYHKHMLYHTSEKPHVCNECGRAFKELSTLHNHERIHSGERPFACETCGKCFRQRVSYLVHRRIHTGVMPYKCTACDKSFRYKVSQRSHKCTANPPGTVVRATEVANQESNPTLQPTAEPSQSWRNKKSSSKNEATLSTPVEYEEPKSMASQNKQAAKRELKSSDGLENSPADGTKSLVFNIEGQIIAQNFSFVPGCEIVAVHPENQSVPMPSNDANLNQNPQAKHLLAYMENSNNLDHHLDLNTQHAAIPYETPDFFSMVLSASPPMLPDVQSLHLHSPKDKHDEHAHILETINEESLKELLYGPSH